MENNNGKQQWKTTMENNCKNCETVIADNFCGNCGQKKYKRIDRKYLIDELQYTFLHTNKGFFYSIKNILRNPGKTAKDFIDGNRVNHYKPILLAFVLSGISTFISFKILGVKEIMEAHYEKQKIPKTVAHDIISFLSSYNSLFMLLFIPIVSIVTYLIFKSWKKNYYEHIIMNAYIQSFYTIASILFLYPILFFVKDTSTDAYFTISMLASACFPILMVWFYKQFYIEKSLSDIIIKVLIFIAIGAVLFIAIIFIGIIVVVFVQGPEAFLQYAPKK